MIPDDVVELAACTAWEAVAGVWAELDETTRESERGAMRAALEAAAPLIAAKALRDAAEDMADTDDPDAIHMDNGDADLWLTARADRIERGES